MEALWKAKLEEKRNPPQAARLQWIAAEYQDPEQESAHEPKKQKLAGTHPEPPVSHAYTVAGAGTGVQGQPWVQG
jgi:hypothetical protein